MTENELPAPTRAPASVILVGPLPPPSGGMANQTQQLARLLADDGCSVTLVQTNVPYRPRWIGRVRGMRALVRLIPYLRNLWRAMERADVVHVMANSGMAWHLFAAPAIWIARLRERFVVVNYRGGGAGPFLSRQGIVVRLALLRASLIVVPSRFLQRVFDSHAIETRVVPNIVDTTLFSSNRSDDRGWHAVVARNLEDIYDIPTAIRAFALIHQHQSRARLTIAGSGPARKSLEEIVDELGLSRVVTFTGRLDNERMAAVYRTCDIMLNPSLVDNMPISLLEAMASGVPIVSTNVGGIPDMVDDGKSALLVPAGAVEAMASSAIRVLGDRELAEKLRNAGFEASRRYTWPEVRPVLYAVYETAKGAPSFKAATPAARGASTRGMR